MGFEQNVFTAKLAVALQKLKKSYRIEKASPLWR